MAEQGWLRVERTVTLGNIGAFLMCCVTGALWVSGGSTKADQAQRDLVAFQAAVSAQLVEIKTTMDKMDRRLDAVQMQMQAIPTVAERMQQQDRRMSAAEDRTMQHDNRLNVLEQGQAAMKSELASMAKERDQGHR